jgi:hypothetical protein
VWKQNFLSKRLEVTHSMLQQHTREHQSRKIPPLLTLALICPSTVSVLTVVVLLYQPSTRDAQAVPHFRRARTEKVRYLSIQFQRVCHQMNYLAYQTT